MTVLSSLRQWHGRLTAGLIDVGENGFCVRFGRRSHGMHWTDITRIEAGRSPSPIVDIFYVMLFDETGHRFKLDDRMYGFKAFESAMLLHWPGLRQAWTHIFCGRPEEAKHATLWVAPPDAN